MLNPLRSHNQIPITRPFRLSRQALPRMRSTSFSLLNIRTMQSPRRDELRATNYSKSLRRTFYNSPDKRLGEVTIRSKLIRQSH